MFQKNGTLFKRKVTGFQATAGERSRGETKARFPVCESPRLMQGVTNFTPVPHAP